MDEMIEGRELEVQCWQCDWKGGRTLSWLSSQRHMICPECSSVIVLDTSKVRREIARQRRQLSALRAHMGRFLQEEVSQIARPPPRALHQGSMTPRLDLALARKHPETLLPCMRPAATTRRF